MTSPFLKRSFRPFRPLSPQDQSEVEQYLREVGKHPFLSDREVKYLALRVKYHKDKSVREAARNTLVNANLRLVLSIAKHYLGKGVSYSDLVQEGNLGLLRAAEKYDPQLEGASKFSTYAVPWIAQYLSRVIDRDRATVKVPTRSYRVASKLRVIAQDLAPSQTAQPSAEQLAREFRLRFPEIKIRSEKLLEIARGLPRSQYFSSDDFDLESRPQLRPESVALIRESLAIVKDELNYFKAAVRDLESVTERAKADLICRYGLNNSLTLVTLVEIGRQAGCSRQRVDQRIKKAWQAIKAELDCDERWLLGRIDQLSRLSDLCGLD